MATMKRPTDTPVKVEGKGKKPPFKKPKPKKVTTPLETLGNLAKAALTTASAEVSLPTAVNARSNDSDLPDTLKFGNMAFDPKTVPMVRTEPPVQKDPQPLPVFNASAAVPIPHPASTHGQSPEQSESSGGKIKFGAIDNNRGQTYSTTPPGFSFPLK